MDRAKLSRLFDMTGRVVIVTGGTRGIGRALAEGYVSAGARVVVASRKPDACQETERHLRKLGGEAIGVPTHLGDLDALPGLVEKTVDAFGAIDVVVNNAATALAQPVGEYTPEAWAKSLDVNLRGPVFLAQAALPHLRKSPNAAVLNVLSGAAFLFSARVSLYGIGKAGLMASTRSMAAELAPDGIRVNALSPGTVETDMVLANTPEQRDEMTAIQLMPRMAHPDEMVGPALMLTSDAGSFITGHVVFADGGMVPR
ncbi:MAG: SDR family oxidoreductase [Deltaproteobacteria bacterium]|nr:SDR family oxidoreductase [Deltaproteobacteria bacterium]MBW2497751.1 SDR family oxidoreductase [Deltaproteobacteria bacterium]